MHDRLLAAPGVVGFLGEVCKSLGGNKGGGVNKFELKREVEYLDNKGRI